MKRVNTCDHLQSLLLHEYKSMAGLRQNYCDTLYVSCSVAISFRISFGLSRENVFSFFLTLFPDIHRRHREKLQAHLSDSRSLRDCSVNASGLMSKSTTRSQYNQPLQKVRCHLLLLSNLIVIVHVISSALKSCRLRKKRKKNSLWGTRQDDV